MSVLMRGVNMPKNCEECNFKGECRNYWEKIREAYTRPSWCPLVEVSDSENPNNCEVKNYCDDCLYTDTCDSKKFFYACTSKATISKMEQVEDEPQTQLTAKCLECNNSKACKENHWQGCRYEPLGYEVTAVVGTIKDEPQTERSEYHRSRKVCTLELFDDDGFYIEPL